MNHGELLAKIRRNDPTVTRVSVSLHMHQRYGAAFQGNTVVEDLSVALRDFPRNIENEYGSLLYWVQTSPSLRKISLRHGDSQLIRRFLLAIANNPGIQHVDLRCMRDTIEADAFALLFRSTRSNLKLELWRCGFHPADADPIVPVLHDALHGNTSLQSLSIDECNFQVYNTLLPVLSSCRTITEVALCPSRDDRARCTQEMAEFLQSPMSIEHLHLRCFREQDEGFERIFQHLMRNESIAKVTFEGCRFSHASTQAFKNLFQSNTRIQTLVISGFITFSGPEGTDDTGAVLGSFVRSNTSLKELDISDLYQEQFFCEIISALEANSTVEHLKCGHLNDERCKALTNNFSKWSGLKELSFRLNGTYGFRKEDMLRAFKHNSSLTNVAIDQAPRTNYLTAADLKRVQFYTKRNKHVPPMLASSTDVIPVYLRPKLWNAVRKSSGGPTEIFRDLVRLGDKVGTAGSRKRRRPNYYISDSH